MGNGNHEHGGGLQGVESCLERWKIINNKGILNYMYVVAHVLEDEEQQQQQQEEEEEEEAKEKDGKAMVRRV